MFWKELFRSKPLEKVLADAQKGQMLRRVLGPGALTALGIGAIIGTGIFVLVGKAAHSTTGPALMLSFVVSGTACIFAALCYAEFASMAPVAGSAYTYAYTTMGELMAWIIGWDLVLEYAVASCTVAHGWSKYFQDLMKQVMPFFGAGTGIMPHIFADSPLGVEKGSLVFTGSFFDLPALVIALLVTMILVRGIKESAIFNAVMVAIKLGVVLFVIFVGMFHINPDNWTPFAPYGYGGLSFFGNLIYGQVDPNTNMPIGMMAGAALIFFAYLGFDAVSTNAEEARNPQRDVPIGIISSLIICTILYIAVAAVLTGMVPYDKIQKDAPVAQAFEHVGMPWARFLVSVGALTGITSVLLVMMLGQPRIFLAMARDGLVPEKFFSSIHPVFQTPWKSTLLTGAIVGIGGSLLPLDILAELTNIGTLFAFVVVCAAVLVMRITHPHTPRAFRAPLGSFTPIMGILLCLLLMFSLGYENWLRLIVWLIIGLFIYFDYGYLNSKIREITPLGKWQYIQNWFPLKILIGLALLVLAGVLGWNSFKATGSAKVSVEHLSVLFLSIGGVYVLISAFIQRENYSQLLLTAQAAPTPGESPPDKAIPSDPK
ncbi:MAG: amino acid permease [Gemmataceae bacterium]|nr:amino acid permease [Gemmataceae bacterium]